MLDNLVAVAEGALNRALALDPDAGEALRALDGRTMAVTLTGFDQTVFVFPVADRIHLTRHWPTGQMADVRLTGRASDFLQLARSRGAEQQATLLSGGVQIEGDATLAQRFASAFERIDPDWLAPIDGLLGPAASGQIERAARGLFDFAMRSVDQLARASSDHLRNETGDLVHGTDVERWIADVDSLRDGVARAEARLKRLAARLPNE